MKGFKDTTKMRYYADGGAVKTYSRGDSKRVAPSKKTAKPVEKTMKPTAKQGKAPLTGGLGQATAAEAKTLGSKMGRKKGYRSFSAKPMFGKG